MTPRDLESGERDGRCRRRRARWLMTLALGGALGLAAGDALAVVGAPLTPVSYAGVARRTARRTTGRTAAAETAVAATTVAVLPAGCAKVAGPGGAVYTCGGRYYRPTYDGPNVVYVVSTSP